jgi:hypothetical protein
MDLLDALDWISLNAKSGGNYTIALGKDEAITPTELGYGGKTLTITLKSAGGEHTVSFDGANPSYSLFNVKSGVTFTLENGVTLRGTQNDAAKSLVEVTGGRFVMNGGVITGNKSSDYGGGVLVTSGSFTMSSGVISGNTANRGGGGVAVTSGSFTMSGGVINENTHDGFNYGSGGGVYVAGTFTMSGGDINGNKVSGIGTNGGGVYVRGTFIMKDGVISGNTTNSSSGGGVFVSGTFTMTGGTISENTASNGGGLFVMQSVIFTKSGGGGVIYGSNAQDDQANRASSDSDGHAVYINRTGKKRNTTARAATAMDSTKDGPAGAGNKGAAEGGGWPLGG